LKTIQFKKLQHNMKKSDSDFFYYSWCFVNVQRNLWYRLLPSLFNKKWRELLKSKCKLLENSEEILVDDARSKIT